MQAEFFGLLGLADQASAGLKQQSQRAVGDAAGPSTPTGSLEYDSVYVETGFQPVKSEFGALQQQQAATMQVGRNLKTGDSIDGLIATMTSIGRCKMHVHKRTPQQVVLPFSKLYQRQKHQNAAAALSCRAATGALCLLPCTCAQGADCLQLTFLSLDSLQGVMPACNGSIGDIVYMCCCLHVLLCMQELSQLVQSRQDEGFRVVKYSSGVAHDNADTRHGQSHVNLHCLVLLQRQTL